MARRADIRNQTLSPDDPDLRQKLDLHFDLYPTDKEPLQDTATSIRGVPQIPSQVDFSPVGHISLDVKNPEAKKVELNLPSEDTYWIKTFYVSHALRSKGVGRAAMDAVESMAVGHPLNARTLVLDTLHKEDQAREEIGMAYYGGRPKLSNQEWYARRGYRLIAVVQNYYRNPDNTGVIWDLKTVFMRKDLE
ncbi:hypothetical protein G7046_g3738 [Stylonectria norvegica]|nr:hypothetical protein G7046_g3738 [Stylonectria norvegica]